MPTLVRKLMLILCIYFAAARLTCEEKVLQLLLSL